MVSSWELNGEICIAPPVTGGHEINGRYIERAKFFVSLANVRSAFGGTPEFYLGGDCNPR